MQINISSIKNEVGASKHAELDETFNPIEFDGEDVKFKEPVRISLDITNAGDFFNVQGTVSTVIELNCGRCLENFNYVLEFDFNEDYYPVKEENKLLEDEEGIPFTGEEINLEPEIKANIQLSIPMRQVCSEECQGLCTHCGVNLNKKQCGCKDDNVDPRMAVLQDLFKKE